MRIAAGIEYNGSHYHGWQTQHSPQLNTIQSNCEAALARVADHPLTITCAGRTDKGVHALEQVIHFDTTAERSMYAWVTGSNHYLPSDIRLLWACKVNDDFHARYSALARRYRYLIYNHSVRPALMHQRVSWYPYPLDEAAMSTATQYLLGEHDFSAFRGADCQAKTTQRRVDYIEITRNHHYIGLDIEANAFLHHMVRNIVGVLLEIGRDVRAPEWAQEVLLSRQRNCAGITAAPDGLYLTRVNYPPEWQLPQI